MATVCYEANELTVSASMWKSPAAMACTAKWSRVVTRRGVLTDLEVRSWMPRRPKEVAPQLSTAPVSVSTDVWWRPHTSCTGRLDPLNESCPAAVTERRRERLGATRLSMPRRQAACINRTVQQASGAIHRRVIRNGHAGEGASFVRWTYPAPANPPCPTGWPVAPTPSLASSRVESRSSRRPSAPPPPHGPWLPLGPSRVQHMGPGPDCPGPPCPEAGAARTLSEFGAQ